MRLSAIFQHPQIMATSQRQQRVKVNRLPIQMHGQNDFGARRDGRLDQIHIKVVRRQTRLDRYHGGATLRHGQPSRNVGVAGHDHFITGAYPHR